MVVTVFTYYLLLRDLREIFDPAELEVKVGLSPSKKICFICFNESPLKMVKNGFYFIKDTLMASDNFKNKQKNLFLICMYYVYV